MDIKQWEERKAQLPGRIKRENHTTTFYYKGGQTVASVNGEGTVVVLNIDALGDQKDSLIIDKEFLDSIKLVKEEIFDELAFVHARTLAQSKHRSFDSEFRAAVFKDLNIDPKHPKAFKLWEKAMDNRCGEGLNALYEEVSDLSELLS